MVNGADKDILEIVLERKYPEKILFKSAVFFKLVVGLFWPATAPA
jgi:hypothetical protein